MSILIKGMKMPKSCWECPMVSGYEIADEARTICSTVRCRLTNTKRPAGEAIAPDCPLVTVPPHGRLGDLDAFESIKYELPNGQKAFNRGFHSGVQYVQHLIMDAPTIIPAEEGE